ncbi:hypothetical protein ACOMHN_022979 [Nucella lapillus]
MSTSNVTGVTGYTVTQNPPTDTDEEVEDPSAPGKPGSRRARNLECVRRYREKVKNDPRLREVYKEKRKQYDKKYKAKVTQKLREIRS